MKKIILYESVFVVLFISLVFSLNAQNREERTVNGKFSELHASSGINLFVKQGDKPEIIVEADDDVLDDVKTELKGNTLNVYFYRGRRLFNWSWNKSAKVYVTTKKIVRLSSSGGANLKSVGAVKADKLEVSASGGGDAEVSLEASEVFLNASGGGDITVVGKADFLEVHASGGADIKARELHARKVVATSSGGADVYVYASESIEASASGGADVDYYGSAKATKISESGGGDVTGH
jgi:hypothetical protein